MQREPYDLCRVIAVVEEQYKYIIDICTCIRSPLDVRTLRAAVGLSVQKLQPFLRVKYM